MIYPGGDIDALVNTIEIFLLMNNKTRIIMGQAGRKYVEKNFSRSIVVAEYKKKIKELIEELPDGL